MAGVAEGRKRRASKACISCRARKVKCNVLQSGPPCAKCREDGFDCCVNERKKRRTKSQGSSYAANGNEADSRRNLYPSPRGDSARADSKLSSLPPHVASHQIPHYPFFRNLPQNTDPQPPSSSQDASSSQTMQMLSPRNGHDSGLSLDDFHFLKRKGAFELPSQQLLDKLVSNYFAVFHPFFPVIDKSSFLTAYDNLGRKDRQGPSLLLLQAILFTSSASVPFDVLEQMQFESRHQARSLFHNRAKLLFEFDHEESDLVSIQALLLLSHYYPSMTNQKHTWFWVQQAICLAQGVGLHRDPGDVPQRKLWARVWWACLSRDRLIALGTGRPMHINSLDCDVPPLTPADLFEEGDTNEDTVVKTIFCDFIKLCQYMEGVLSLTQTESTTSDKEALQEQIRVCESTLQHWLDHLHPVAQRFGHDITGATDLGICTMYRTLLHMVYNIVVITLKQSYHFHGYNQVDTLQPPLPQVQAAADDSARLAFKLINDDVVRMCPTICVTAILPPLIVHLLQLRTGTSGDKSAYASHFNVCINLLEKLSDVYWHAKFYHDVFSKGLQDDTAGSANSQDQHDRLAAFLRDKLPGQRSSKPLRPKPSSLPHTKETTKIPERLVTDDNGTAAMSSEVQTANKSPAVTGESTTAVDSTGSAINVSEPSYEVLGMGDSVLEDLDMFHLEDWLNDFGYLYNGFPSA